MNAATSAMRIAALVKARSFGVLVGRFVLNSDEITQDHEKCKVTLPAKVDTIIYFFIRNLGRAPVLKVS